MEHCSYRHSDFYDLIPLLMSSIESHLSNKPKQEWKHCSYRHGDFYDLIPL